MSKETATDQRRLAVIGFGEAGRILAAGLAASGRFDVSAYDILVDDPAARAGMLAAAAERGVRMAETHADAIAGARIVVSAVTATASTDVAREAAAALTPGQIFADINSVSPGTKRKNATLIEDAGGHYVDVAVMAPVPPYGLAVPILLGGAKAAELAARLGPAGMKMEVVAPDVGTASAIKMCRSVMIKGIEALVVESLLGARRYGVEDRVIASLDETFPQMKWSERADYLVSRVVVHGRRRAAEMREVAATLSEARLEPFMARATAQCQDRVADFVDAGVGSRAAGGDFSWRAFADALAEFEKRDAGPPHALCPKCGQHAGVEIVYGYPGQELLEAAGHGDVALGGCCVTAFDPDRHCRACGHEWRSESARGNTSGSELQPY